MNHEWLYRATGAQEGLEVTRELAAEYGFISRNPHAETGAMIAHVAGVDFGDIIHLYFAAGSTGTLLGAYRVVGPVKHPHGEIFGPAVTRTKLRTVLESPLKEFLERSNYQQDVSLGAYCGWPIVPEEARSPSYIREMFPGKNALVKR